MISLEGIHASEEEKQDWHISEISQFMGKLYKLSLGMVSIEFFSSNIIRRWTDGRSFR